MKRDKGKVKVRDFRRYNMCERKRKHTDIEPAKQSAIAQYLFDGNRRYGVYECPYCKCFHVGKIREELGGVVWRVTEM